MTPAPLRLEAVAASMDGLGAPELVAGPRVRLRLDVKDLRDGIVRARDRLACDHLIHLAAVDTGKAFELHYHFTGPHRTVLTLVVERTRDAPQVPSVADLLPPAGLYERQIHDLFGIVFEGHPALRRVILNDDWPEGEYPLRKDWKMDPSKDYGGVPEEVG